MGKRFTLKNVLLAIAATVVSLIVYRFFGGIIKNTVSNELYANFIGEAVFTAVAVLSVFVLKRTDVFQSEPGRLKEGWLSAAFLFIVILFFGFFSIIAILNATLSLPEWLAAFGFFLLIGFCEEVLFRGLIQGALHGMLGEDTHGKVLLAVALGGLAFGATHLTNFLRGISFQASLVQAIVTSFMGMYFGAIYYRTGKNVWYVALLHSLYDAVLLMTNGYLNGTSVNTALDATGTASPYTALIWPVVYTALVLFILRPQKIEPLLKKQIEQ